MARFYAVIQGNRGAVSRLGSKTSGITARLNGWNVGARVTLYMDADGNDCVMVERTGGSNGKGTPTHVATFRGCDSPDGTRSVL